MKINVSGRLYDIAPYEVSPDDHRIDMDEVARIARERRPKLLLAGWSAYPRVLDFARFREIADEVGALLMVDMAHFAGLVAAGLHPEPGALRRRRHDDGAQDARRRARRPDPVPRGVREEDRLGRLPGPAGRPAGARDRRQGRRVPDRRRRAAVPRAPGAHGRGRAGRGRGAARRRRRRQRAHRRHRRAPRAGRPARLRARRRAGRGPAARHRHHRQPQRRPVRPAAAGGLVGPARRHARAGHARPPGRGLHGDRADHRHRAAARLRRRARRPRPSASTAIAERYPLYAQLGAPAAV